MEDTKTKEELEAEVKSKENLDGDKVPSDEELSDTFDKLFEEENVGDVVEGDNKADENSKIADELQDDNAEKSRLGRKVKAMEEENKRIKESLDEILKEVRSGKQVKSEPVTDKLESDDDEQLPDTITTPEDLERYNRVKAKNEQKAITTYQTKYRSLIKGFETDEHYNDVISLIKTNAEFDKIYTGDPEIDVEINYNKAAKVVLSKKIKAGSAKKIDVHGDDGDAPPAGLSGSTRVAKTTDSEIELDEHAKAFVDKVKMSKEDVSKALEGDTPLNLKKDKR